jgi:NitT/TauT family transport system ATP-binding protein/sulfonate transport system ATP-binding protein
LSFLHLDSISKTYTTNGIPLEVLDDLSLEVNEGEFVVILGPSGCGKSTLLRIVAGLERPTHGRISLDGKLVDSWGRDRTLIFQEYTLFPWLTAEENLSFGLRLMGKSADECHAVASQWLERLGLAAFADYYPHELSGGMQQRVALGRALAVDPAVLLMDEPFAAVDALTRSRLQGQVRDIVQGKTVLFVTHSIREATLLSDRIVILTHLPARVQRELTIDIPHPRDLTPEHAAMEAEIERELLSTDAAES